MNTGQTMLVIAAFALLSTITLAINATIVGSTTIGYEMEANLNALSIGQGMLDEIMSRDFDENATLNRRVNNFSGMTLAVNFGPDGGETISGVDASENGTFRSMSNFDDVDDYHKYVRWAKDRRLGWFIVKDTIEYINEKNPDNVSSTRTFQKRISVSIENPSMPKDRDGNVIIYKLIDVAVYRRYF